MTAAHAIGALPVGTGLLGLTACPGGRGPDSLAQDIADWRRWGAAHVLSLLESGESRALRLDGLGSLLAAEGITWHRLPIPDFGLPDAVGMARWAGLSPGLHQALDAGQNVLIHCRAGLGRSGTMGALLLVERGLPPQQAIDTVRAARPGAIETAAQARWLHDRGR
ncbi:MAG: cyclin-dependent kinase inhibitor 3 family protein [Pararhodobacter sp.]|nr:cyclin-dependent kinase inhibitor 3 family protein [Pararhodobacter sp.]